MSAEPILVHCDGLCQPRNPDGWACWAWVAFYPDGREMSHAYGCLGQGDGMTNNLSEYEAVQQALRRAEKKGRSADIYTDSKLVVEQAYGRWSVKAPHLYKRVVEVRNLLKRTNSTLTWHPREKNAVADAYTRKAYQEAKRQQLVRTTT
jgi:ribonuclease HI